MGGLITSFFIGYALRQWVPQMSSEAHHLLCVCSGVLHTLLGVSQQEFENHSVRARARCCTLCGHGLSQTSSLCLTCPSSVQVSAQWRILATNHHMPPRLGLVLRCVCSWPKTQSVIWGS